MIHLAIQYLADRNQQKETYNKQHTDLTIATNIFWLIGSLYAVYLSVSCNTLGAVKPNLLLLIWNAFWAFAFGWLYVIAYYYSWSNQCSY